MELLEGASLTVINCLCLPAGKSENSTKPLSGAKPFITGVDGKVHNATEKFKLKHKMLFGESKNATAAAKPVSAKLVTKP